MLGRLTRVVRRLPATPTVTRPHAAVLSTSVPRAKVGNPLPKAVGVQMARSWDDAVADGFEVTPSGELFKGKRVVLFGLPGAFTGVCTGAHVPGYVAAREELASLGVDAVYCVAVNDFVTMHAWARSMGVGEEVQFVADVDGELVGAELGLDTLLAAAGLGHTHRSTRFALVANDGVIEHLFVEEAPSKLVVSSAEHVVSALK